MNFELERKQPSSMQKKEEIQSLFEKGVKVADAVASRDMSRLASSLVRSPVIATRPVVAAM
jgi:arginine repressor